MIEARLNESTSRDPNPHVPFGPGEIAAAAAAMRVPLSPRRSSIPRSDAWGSLSQGKGARRVAARLGIPARLSHTMAAVASSGPQKKLHRVWLA